MIPTSSQIVHTPISLVLRSLNLEYFDDSILVLTTNIYICIDFVICEVNETSNELQQHFCQYYADCRGINNYSTCGKIYSLRANLSVLLVSQKYIGVVTGGLDHHH